MYDSLGVEVLAETDCMRLLREVPLGRIVYTDRALPAIQPVNFAVSGADIVIRTTVGSKLAAVTRNAVVAFEADSFDAEARTGWSVVIVGLARVADGRAEREWLREVPLETWAPGARDNFILITPSIVTGRRVKGAAPAPHGGPGVA